MVAGSSFLQEGRHDTIRRVVVDSILLRDMSLSYSMRQMEVQDIDSFEMRYSFACLLKSISVLQIPCLSLNFLLKFLILMPLT